MRDTQSRLILRKKKCNKKIYKISKYIIKQVVNASNNFLLSRTYKTETTNYKEIYVKILLLDAILWGCEIKLHEHVCEIIRQSESSLERNYLPVNSSSHSKPGFRLYSSWKEGKENVNQFDILFAGIICCAF